MWVSILNNVKNGLILGELSNIVQVQILLPPPAHWVALGLEIVVFNHGKRQARSIFFLRPIWVLRQLQRSAKQSVCCWFEGACVVCAGAQAVATWWSWMLMYRSSAAETWTAWWWGPCGQIIVVPFLSSFSDSYTFKTYLFTGICPGMVGGGVY